MNWEEIWPVFIDNFKKTRWPEWVSTLTQILSVWYARKNNVWVYPTGIIGVVLAAFIYLFETHPPLYADGVLNLYYLVMSLYGWYNWVQKKEGPGYKYPIRWCSPKERNQGIALFAITWVLLYVILTKLTNSNTPVLDSLVSSSAVTAMWWMAKRKIENWHAWIVSNIVAIPLNFYKGLMFFTLMYIVFLGMAWMGLMSWKKKVA